MESARKCETWATWANKSFSPQATKAQHEPLKTDYRNCMSQAMQQKHEVIKLTPAHFSNCHCQRSALKLQLPILLCMLTSLLVGSGLGLLQAIRLQEIEDSSKHLGIHLDHDVCQHGPLCWHQESHCSAIDLEVDGLLHSPPLLHFGFHSCCIIIISFFQADSFAEEGLRALFLKAFNSDIFAPLLRLAFLAAFPHINLLVA